eukprot:9205355-Ditylum_brightwellii.AAC.1
MVHLTSYNYEEIPHDLLLLGFMQEDKVNLIGDFSIVEVLVDMHGTWTKGRGAAAINANKVILQLHDLTEKKVDRMGGALSTFICDPDKYNIDTCIVDYDCVERM